MEKPQAYKLLAQQEGISNSEAKSLIDRGLVYVGNSKVMIARGEISAKTRKSIKNTSHGLKD
jgi:23S rRNA pseudouridine1911/1915/1917 synthase